MWIGCSVSAAPGQRIRSPRLCQDSNSVGSSPQAVCLQYAVCTWDSEAKLGTPAHEPGFGSRLQRPSSEADLSQSLLQSTRRAWA